MPFTFSKVDDTNLSFWYDEEQRWNGVYYTLRAEAPKGFPPTYWVLGRYIQPQQQGTTPVASLPQATPGYYACAIRTFRTVAHTLGPVKRGAVFSGNHWTLYLLIGDGHSVQINMKTNLKENETRGVYQVSHRAYETSNSALQFFDFPAKDGITVGYVLNEIIRRRWDKYNMTESGAGCRWWILTVMRGLAQTCLRDAESVEDVLAPNIKCSWHRGYHPHPLAIQKGTFLEA